MKHDWTWIPKPKGVHPLGPEHRQCLNCKAVQYKEDNETYWGRSTGFKWRPLVGRCKPGEKYDQNPSYK